MRAIHVDLLAAQVGLSRKPHITIAVSDLLGNAYNYTNTGRILAIKEHWEEAYGGGAKIVLNNSDGNFAALDLSGYRVQVNYGYETISGNRTSPTPRIGVLNQKNISYEGKLAVELTCVSAWALAEVSKLYSGGWKLEGTISGTENYVFKESVISSPAGYTGKLVNWGGDSSSSFWIVLPDSNGDDWTTQVAALTRTSSRVLTLTAKTSQSAAGILSFTEQTPVQMLVQALRPVWAWASSPSPYVVPDSDDLNDTMAAAVDFDVAVGIGARQFTRQLMNRSHCGARWSADNNLHVLYLNPAAAVDYTYYNHIVWKSAWQQSLILPNTVIFADRLPDSTKQVAAQFLGSASDAASALKWGSVIDIQIDETITSDALAVLRATAWIAQKNIEAGMGQFLAPMSCNQEVYDMVSVYDQRAALSYQGRVTRLERNFEAGKSEYSITVSLGGVANSSMGTNLDSPWNDLRDLTGGQELSPAIPPAIMDRPFYGAGGTVTIDASGIEIDYSGGSALVKLKYGAHSGYLYMTSAGHIVLANSEAKEFLVTGMDLGLGSGAKFGLLSASSNSAIYFYDAAGSYNHAFSPETNLHSSIGDATHWWADAFINTVRIGLQYNYIATSAGDMDFNIQDTAHSSEVLAMYITHGDVPVLNLNIHSITNVNLVSAIDGDFTGQVDIYGGLDMHSVPITSVLDPVSDQQAATKRYVDWKTVFDLTPTNNTHIYND